MGVEEPIRWVDHTAADTTAAETIAALNRHLGEALEQESAAEELPLGTVTGPDRPATTMIAEWIRDQVLDEKLLRGRGAVPLHRRLRAVLGLLDAPIATITSAPTHSPW